MDDLEKLYEQIMSNNTKEAELCGHSFKVQNCVIATDGNILKMNAYLANGTAEIAVAITIKNKGGNLENDR